MAFQVENQSCPNREQSNVSNNNNNISSSEYNTIANTNKINIVSSSCGISSKRNSYEDPGAEKSNELSPTTSTRVDKGSIYQYNKFGEFRDWKCFEYDSDYNSESESEYERKNNSNNKRGSKRIPTSPITAKELQTKVEQKKHESRALFTLSASKNAFSEKQPIVVPRGDPERYQSKLYKYCELFLGIPYEEYINRDDWNSVNKCRSINDGYEWSSAPICYNS